MNKSMAFMAGAVLVLSSCSYFDRSKENIKTDGKLYLPTGATYASLMDSLKPFLNDPKTFESAASGMGLKHVYPGRYTLKKGETNKALIEKLLKGTQDEISITIGNYSSISELASKVDPILETSAPALIQAIKNRPEAQGLDTRGDKI